MIWEDEEMERERYTKEKMENGLLKLQLVLMK